MVKDGPKKVPQSARLNAGGRVQSLFGQCPNEGSKKLNGSSLTDFSASNHEGDPNNSINELETYRSYLNHIPT